LDINEDPACRKIVSCTNITMIKQSEIIYLKLNVNGRPNLEGATKTAPQEVSWKVKCKMRK
jgi:hypothetical protein